MTETVGQQLINALDEIARLTASLAEWKALAIQWAKDNDSHACFEVVQLQPDDDSPGLWIGFKTGKDRDEAMKLFALEPKS